MNYVSSNSILALSGATYDIYERNHALIKICIFLRKKQQKSHKPF